MAKSIREPRCLEVDFLPVVDFNFMISGVVLFGGEWFCSCSMMSVVLAFNIGLGCGSLIYIWFVLFVLVLLSQGKCYKFLVFLHCGISYWRLMAVSTSILEAFFSISSVGLDFGVGGSIILF